MPENKEIPNRDGYVTFYLGNKKIIADKGFTLKAVGIPKEPNDSHFFTDKQVKSIRDFLAVKRLALLTLFEVLSIISSLV